ncbi:MAG: CBS domain-containing protein [Candidatus Entotheonellia bacterium]
MSPRAAWRLESLGFTQVYDYVTGKLDWLASGLPTEGKRAKVPRAGTVARRDAPTCQLTDRLGDVRDRVRRAGWDVCIVADGEGVVLGLLRGEALDAAPESVIEAIMESGPTTIRPHVPVETLAERLRKQGVENRVVTTSEGRLVGVLYRTDAEQISDGVSG